MNFALRTAGIRVPTCLRLRVRCAQTGAARKQEARVP